MLKRLIYLRTFIKLLSVYSSKFKSNLPSREVEISNVILRQLNDIEVVVQNQDEMTVIIGELLFILNITNLSNISNKAFTQWIKNKSGESYIITSILKTIGVSVSELDVLADILETTLNGYFQNSGKLNVIEEIID